METPAPAPATRKKSTAVSAKRATPGGALPEFVLPPPAHYCHTRPMNATERANIAGGALRAVELTIPASVYGSNPRSFFDMRGHSDIQNQYRQLLHVFGLLAMQAHAPRKVAGEEKGSFTIQPSSNWCAVTFERVPSATDPNVFVCYRLRLTEHSDSGNNPGIAGDLAQHLLRTDQAVASRLHSKVTNRFAERVPPFSYALVDTPRWHDLCHFYRPGPTMQGLSTQFTATNAYDFYSHYNLQRVFTISYGAQLAHNLGAHPAYCDPAIYEELDFADYANVFAIAYSDLDPKLLPARYMPMIRSDPRVHRAALAEWVRLHGPGSEAFFDATCNLTSNSETANDINGLAERVRTETADLRAAYGSSNQYFAQLRLKQREWMQNFSEIFHKSGDCSDSIKAIAGFEENYLAENGNSFTIAHEQVSQNLSYFEDWIAKFTVVLDTVVTVKSEHKTVFVVLMSALGVYQRVDMNNHTMMLGPAAVGKSFALLVLNKLLIDGTVRCLTYITPAAFSADGKANDSLIIILEDAPTSIFGANGGGKNAVSDDVQNRIKQLLTSQEVSVQTLTIQEGIRRIEVHKAQCSVVFFSALNEATSSFPQPILSRHNVIVSAEDDDRSIDAPTLQTKTTRASDSCVKDAFVDVALLMRRTQVLMAKIMYMIACGILPKVNMESADMIFALVALQAHRKYNIKMDDPRKWARARNLVVVLTILKAVLLVWDSPLCPFAGKPHSDLHFLYVAKHLVSTKQIAFFVIGLLSNQWQDNLRTQIIQTLRTNAFPGAQAKIDALAQPVEMPTQVEAPAVPEGVYIPAALGTRPLTQAQQRQVDKPEAQAYLQQKQAYDGMQEVTKYWMYDVCYFGSPLMPAPRSNGNRVLTNDELADHLANQLMPHLHPRPLHKEVVAVLKQLTEYNEETTRREYEPGHTHHVAVEQKVVRPALMIDAEKIRLNLTTLSHASETDPLYLSCTEVASFLYTAQWKPGMADQAQYMYGETEAYPSRFVWRMINAKYRPSADTSRACRVYNPHFFDKGAQEMTNSFLRHINPTEEAVRTQKLFRADAPYTEVNLDLDEYAALLHANDLGLSHAEQTAQPSNVQLQSDRALYEHFASQRRLLVYPACFATRDRSQWEATVARMRTTNPGAFGLQSKMDVARQLQASRTALPPIEPPPAPVRAPLVIPESVQRAYDSDGDVDVDMELRNMEAMQQETMEDELFGQ